MQDILTAGNEIQELLTVLTALVEEKLTVQDREFLARPIPSEKTVLEAFLRHLELEHSLWYLFFRFERVQRSQVTARFDLQANLVSVFRSLASVDLSPEEQEKINETIGRITEKKLTLREEAGDPTVQVDRDRILAVESGQIEQALDEVERRVPELSNLLREKLGN